MKSARAVLLVMSLIGLALLVGSALLYRHTRAFLAEAVSAEGVVVDLVRSRSGDSTAYYPVVEFRTADGVKVEITSTSGSNPPSYKRGEKVRVWYHADEPERAKLDGFFSLWGASAVLGFMGVVFSGFGLGLRRIAAIREERIAFLKRHGTAVKARVQGVERSSGGKGSRLGWTLCAQWQDPATGRMHIFRSDTIRFDPSDRLAGEEVTVLIDQHNPKRYHVDLSFLPEVVK